ncbi:hypothetical protein [Poseidonibacter ostreae]|uniref:Uncharacterized protein n=1 Tax=Poseidonibacter ostreae TaxID=2654171 RepID=A0A6L4WTY2_9BACT|nr:hypothetical protein [Poseidonibacter ostreae]KAB7889536.1 hypothetical protein GBG19_05635 [Poseidonibacter ostreae]
MKKSLYKLEQISQSLNSHEVYYKFNKDLDASDKYRKGRINAAKWLNELIYYFIQKESMFLVEFKEQIQEQRKKLSDLEDGDFKQALFDEFNIIEDMISDRNNSK